MTNKRDKPQGDSGPIRIGDDDVVWQVIEFPRQKDDRERLIARLFVQSFDHYVAMESEPSLAPFEEPQQNDENDLDFTVATVQGIKLMELAEFAPLQTHGPTFATAPNSLTPGEKAQLALDLVQAKSAHQGGTDRFLVLYATEHGFWLDPITIERMRRRLVQDPPRFDRVYYVSVHDLESASVTEIFPGKAHHIFGDRSDEELDGMRIMIPHPTEMIVGRTFEGIGGVEYNGNRAPARIRLEYTGIGSLGRFSRRS